MSHIDINQQTDYIYLSIYIYISNKNKYFKDKTIYSETASSVYQIRFCVFLCFFFLENSKIRFPVFLLIRSNIIQE